MSRHRRPSWRAVMSMKPPQPTDPAVDLLTLNIAGGVDLGKAFEGDVEPPPLYHRTAPAARQRRRRRATCRNPCRQREYANGSVSESLVIRLEALSSAATEPSPCGTPTPQIDGAAGPPAPWRRDARMISRYSRPSGDAGQRLARCAGIGGVETRGAACQWLSAPETTT